MSTARFHATHFEPVFRMPPAPSGLHFVEQSGDSLPVIRTRRPSKRCARRVPVLEMAIVGGVLLFLSSFVLNLIARLQPVESQPKPAVIPTGSQAIIPPVSKGGGEPKSPPLAPIAPGAPPARPAPMINPPERDVDQLIADSIKACREGRFEAAVELGSKAAQLAPHDSCGVAVQLLALYAEQYPGLADEAIDRMNGAVEVDLGPRYGVGAFVERQGDDLVFRARGRQVRLTVRQFNALDGVRFRVTKQYLENGKRPANDLILGAIHYPKQLKPDGTFDQTGVLSQQSARNCWEQAARSHDEQVADHGRSLLWLLKAPETARVHEGRR
jgi:hypothetical protein